MNKIILVTGGSRGIGAATALLAAQHGYTVCINYLHNAAAAKAVEGKILSLGSEAFSVCADISIESDVTRLFDTIDQKGGILKALVNNAAILQKKSLVEHMDEKRLHRIFSVNVIGSFLCAREAIKRMSSKNKGLGGSIVNISSGASRGGSPFEFVDYAASKGAIDTMTVGLAKELAMEHIRVNAIRPGIIDTDIHEPGRVERIKDSIPMKREGLPDEVARAVIWIISDEASYITGALLDVSGGR